MKKRRLKKWVKVVLLLIALVIIGIMVKLCDDLDKKELNRCISIGNSQEYCEKGLR